MNSSIRIKPIFYLEFEEIKLNNDNKPGKVFTF